MLRSLSTFKTQKMYPNRLASFFPMLLQVSSPTIRMPSSFLNHTARREQTYINSHIAQLRPTHRMVQVVLAKVVFGQIRDIGELHVRDIRRPEHANVHFRGCVG